MTRDKDIDLISESLSSIAETEMKISSQQETLTKDVRASYENTSLSIEKVTNMLATSIELDKKIAEELAKQSKTLADFTTLVTNSGILKVISTGRRILLWGLVVIMGGIVWIAFNRITEWYVTDIQSSSHQIVAPEPVKEIPVVPQVKAPVKKATVK
jgi:hypothetical protein